MSDSKFLRVSLISVLLSVSSVVGFGQAQVSQSDNSAPEATVYKSDMGFSYAYPTVWELVDTKPMLPAAQLNAQDKATSDPEKRGAACAQVGFLVRHGAPASVIMSLALPSDCFGQHFAQSDLPSVGEGMSQGLKKNFNIVDSTYSAYKLGAHNVWVERAKGTPQNQPQPVYTIETACTIVEKGMVCLLTLAADADALSTFETGRIAFEGDDPLPLVPTGTFEAKK